MAAEITAIIRNVGYGLRDLGRPCLWFDVQTSESTGALQVFTGKEADKVITDAGVFDVKSLEGRPCWVKVEGGRVTFLRVWQP